MSLSTAARSVAFIIAAQAGLLGMLSNAEARYVDCPDIHLTGTDKVVVGDLTVASNTGASATINQTRLKNALRQQLSDLKVSEGGEIGIAGCPPGHQPEKAEIKPAYVSSIFASGAVLEIWGLATDSEAQMDYVLVPLLPPIRPGEKPDGFYAITYSFGSETAFKKIFKESLELRAFALLGTGLRALADAPAAPSAEAGQTYGNAYKVLCRAHDFLMQAKAHPGGDDGSIPGKEWDALISLALASANDAGEKTPKLQDVVLKDCVVKPPVARAEAPPQ